MLHADEMRCVWFISLHNGTMSAGIMQDKGNAANTKRVLCKCKHNCTLVDYYLAKLKVTPGMLKYIANSKLCLTSKGSGMYMKQAANCS